MAENVALLSLGANCFVWRNGSKYFVNNTVPIDGDDGTWANTFAPADGDDGFWVDLALDKAIMGAGFIQSGEANRSCSSIRIFSSQNDTDWTLRYDGLVSAFDWDCAITPTLARYWRFEPSSYVPLGWRVATLRLWVDEYVSPSPPEGQLTTDLQQKIATRYAEIFTPWNLLQAAPTSCEPMTMLAVIGLWNNWLLDEIYQNMGSGGGECLYEVPDPDNQTIFNRIVAVEDQVNLRADGIDTLIGALATKINQLEEYIFGIPPDHAYSLLDVVANHVNDINIWIQTEGADVVDQLTAQHTATKADLRGLLDKDHSDLWNAVFDPTWGAIRQINDNTNAVELAIRNDVTAAKEAILAALAAVQADTDDIQETLATLSIPACLSFRWPGASGVTFGAPVPCVTPTEITATCHGVVVEVTDYPPGQSRQPGGATLRYKGIGWLAFRNDRGDYEAIEQIHLANQVIITRQLEQAVGMAVYCKPGATLLITPFTIDGV